MDIRRRNAVAVALLMAFGINMMLGAVAFGSVMLAANFIVTEYFNPRWAFIFPAVLLALTGVLTGVVVMARRAVPLTGAFWGAICGAMVSAALCLLMPQWISAEQSLFDSPGGNFVFGREFIIAALTAINAVSGMAAARKNDRFL